MLNACGLRAAAVIAAPACALLVASPALAVVAQPRAVQQGLAAQVRAAEQRQLKAMDVPAAWKISRGRGVTVGVLDTGVDPSAPDLTGSVVDGPDFAKGIDPPGYQPPYLHGTFIASLIAGHGSGPGHAGGVIGVAPAASVLSVRVIPDDSEPGLRVYNRSSAYDDTIGQGIRYAVRHGVSVINMSLGGPEASRDMRAAIGYAISRGVVVVAAAGNGGTAGRRFTPYSYPASYTGVISVAALTVQGIRASFSQRNSSVVISAPGVHIIGAGPGGSYLIAEGTSPASAFVAGIAALIRSRYPGLAPPLVEQAMVSSTRRRPPAGYDPGTGFGEVDAAAALRAAAVLAAARPEAGMPAVRFFGTGPRGPIQVVHRDQRRIAAEYGAAAAAGLGFAGALILLMVLAWRGRRERRRRARAALPAGAAPAWPDEPWPADPAGSAAPGPGGSAGPTMVPRQPGPAAPEVVPPQPGPAWPDAVPPSPGPAATDPGTELRP
ncbi:MAG TPA: S8 family serine peptidase [Streptosporangiaceae bacterium]